MPYYTGYLRAVEFVELQSNIETWFRKHPDDEIPMCDIKLFAAPGYALSDVVAAVSRLVKQDVLERRVIIQNGYFSKAYYRLLK